MLMKPIVFKGLCLDEFHYFGQRRAQIIIRHFSVLGALKERFHESNKGETKHGHFINIFWTTSESNLKSWPSFFKLQSINPGQRK